MQHGKVKQRRTIRYPVVRSSRLMNGVFTDQQISLAISDLGLGDVRAMLVTLIYGPVLTLLGPLSDLHMYTSYSHRTYGHTGTDGKRER